MHTFRAAGTAPDQAPTQTKVREVVGLIMREPSKLTVDGQSRLQALLDRCPELNALDGHVRAFAEMIRERRGDRLREWIDEVQAADLPALHTFVSGLRRDHDAVVAGLTMRRRSGRVDGHVNRLKMLERQMFGRANLDLLRRRVLATWSRFRSITKLSQKQFRRSWAQEPASASASRWTPPLVAASHRRGRRPA